MPHRSTTPTPDRTSPLKRLHAIRHSYGADSRQEKLALIARLEPRPLRSAHALRAYHDDLLFLRAFPDDGTVLAAASAALAHMMRRVRALSPAQRRHLDDSGMAGTTTRHAFAFGTAQWIVAGREDADIDWPAVVAPERLDPLLRLFLTPAEGDAFDSGELTTRQWLDMARGESPCGSLGWLLHAAGSSAQARRPMYYGAPDAQVTRLLYEGLDLPVRWRLTSGRSTSGNAVAGAPVHFRTGMRSAPVEPLTLITTPLPSIRRLSPERAVPWLDASRAALAARCREVHAITYANLAEVYLADLGEGTALCLIGADRHDRLTLEANYGYVLFSNGVPLGYGGVTPLASQANTGINIFDAFRHSEAPLLFAQSLRAFRTLFGVTRFVVNPYQFGAGNDEALSSGAFWFYDRLGFRPADASAQRLADEERARRSASRNHRSAQRTLRRLAAGDLVLELPGAAPSTLFEERWLVTLASAVTESLAAPDAATRLRLCDERLESVARVLGLRRWRAAGRNTMVGLLRLAPILALVLDQVTGWPPHDRRALAHLIRAKGSLQERGFAVASRDHSRLWRALRRYCRRRETTSG